MRTYIYLKTVRACVLAFKGIIFGHTKQIVSGSELLENKNNYLKNVITTTM